MSLITPHIHQPLSIFDLIETFQIESQGLHHQIKDMSKTTNSLIQIIKAQDNPQLQQAFSNLMPAEDQLTSLTDVDKKFSRINDMMETIIQAYFQEQMAQTSQNAEANKKDFSHFRESETIPRSIYEQERAQWEAEKQALEEKVATLTKDLEETKAALVENCAGSWNEEKENQKKMEMWFKRRLDAIEHHILDLKVAPEETSKYDRLLNKVRHVKKKQPWNDSKRPNLELDEAALNQKSDVYSNGTSTPFSHYVCVLSSAASENNPLDKGFMFSNNNSCRMTNKSQHSFLSEPLSKSMINTKQAHLESVMKKLQDSRLSITQKEKLFCDMYKHSSPSANDAFVHVRLEDILNAANVSRSHDSLSLDLNSNGVQPRGTFRFNHNMRLDGLKDTKLEKAISTIQSQGSQKSSELFGTSLKRSKSLEHEKMFCFGSPDKNLEHLMDLDVLSKEREDIQSALDKGIIQEISIEQGGGGQFIEQESNNMLDLLQNMLSSKKPVIDRREERVEMQRKKEDDIIDLSEIVNKKEDEMNKAKLDEKPSFLGDEDDEDFKNFLEKEGGKDLSILHSINKKKQLTSQKKCSSKKKERVAFDMKNIEKNLSKKFSEAIEETSSVENDKENMPVQQAVNEALLDSPEKKQQEQEEEEELVHSQVVVRKSSEIPILDFNKIKEKFQKQNNKIVSPTIIVDSAIHISSAETQKRDSEQISSSKSSTTEHIIVSPALLPLTESPHIQQTRFSKVPIKAGPEATEGNTSVSAFFGYYNPRKSMDAQPTFLQPRPPAIIKKKIHQRPNLSLVDDVKITTPNAYEKPPQRPHHPSHSPSMFNMGSDLFLDVEYQFQYQEQEGCQENFQAHQVKKSVDFRQNHRADYNKNTRNSWSFTIDQEQKFGNPPKVQMHSQVNSLLGRNTHLRQKTTEPGPPKAQNQSYFVRSSFSSTPQQFQAAMINNTNPQVNVSYPSSYESTQEGGKGIVQSSIGNNNGLNLLKKVLPSENSKVHQTPIKLEHSGIENQSKEMITVQKENKTPKEFLTNSREKGKEMRPISPLSQNRGGDPDFKLALPLQRKSKFAEEKYISIANTPVNGSAQFRARMFAPKKV